MHVIFVDNGRTDVLASECREILRCIRCGACMNVCPVYRQVSGHAYRSVYPGPVGAVLSPLLAGEHFLEKADLPKASSLCGACNEVCPVNIPIPDLLLRLRDKGKREGAPSPGLPPMGPWALLASQPLAWKAALFGGRMLDHVPGALVPGAGLSRVDRLPHPGDARVHPARRAHRHGARHDLRRLVALPRAQGRPDGERVDPRGGHLARAVPRLSKVGVRDATILEHNITQTAGSAGESIAFGIGVTMPAILILGFDLELTRVMLVAMLGGPAGHPDDDPAAPRADREGARHPQVSRRHRLRRRAQGRRQSDDRAARRPARPGGDARGRPPPGSAPPPARR
jgi:ferredoxin